jgi:hypothetical protein
MTGISLVVTGTTGGYPICIGLQNIISFAFLSEARFFRSIPLQWSRLCSFQSGSTRVFSASRQELNAAIYIAFSILIKTIHSVPESNIGTIYTFFNDISPK